MNKTTVIQGNK